jgi:hypothetical protein
VQREEKAEKASLEHLEDPGWIEQNKKKTLD